MRLDERLDDRQLPFPEKLEVAHRLLATCNTVADLEELLEWTLSTLFKLSKAANPRPEVFLSDQLWIYIHDLLGRCFPERRSFTSSRHGRVRVRQPILPVFVCYCRLATTPSAAFTCAFEKLFHLFISSTMEINGQLQNFVELSLLSQKHASLVDKSVQMVLYFCTRQDSIKTYSNLLSVLPQICASEEIAEETVDGIVSFLCELCEDKQVLPDTIQQTIKKLPSRIQVAFLKAKLTALKASLLLDEYRRFGFALCRFILSTCTEVEVIIRVMNEMNVYVHKNDDIYTDQQSFLCSLLPSLNSLSALLELDFYLVLTNLNKLNNSLLEDKQVQLSLYRHAVKSRQLDDLIKSLRHIGVPANQDALFESLLQVDLLLVRHYQEMVSDCKDEYWVVLLYCSGLEVQLFEKRLKEAQSITQEQIDKLMRFYDPSRPVQSIEPNSLEFVPEMTKTEFKKFLNGLDTDQVFSMLKVPTFYELHQLQRPFEQWLIKVDPLVQSRALLLCPSDYLTNKTVKKLLHLEGIVRSVKRRPKIIKHILENMQSIYPVELLKLAARFAVKLGKEEYIQTLIHSGHVDLILQVRPINPKIAALVLLQFDPLDYRFMPYILTLPDGPKQYPITDPQAKLHYPHLYNVKLDQVNDGTVEIIREYPIMEQFKYLSKHGHLALQMLHDVKCRKAAISYLRTVTGISDGAVVECLVQLTRDVPYDQWLHRIALSCPRPSTLLVLSMHRPDIYTPLYIVDFTRSIISCQMDSDLLCKLLSSIMATKSRVVDEALLVLLVHFVSGEEEVEMRVMEVLRRVARRVEVERAMALCGDRGKARLRDLLV